MADIRLSKVGHAYGKGLYALEQADIRFEDGKTYALLGPSGCGKTTMLNIISGLLFPSDGQVLLGGVDVTRLPTARRNIAQVFQFPVVYQSKSVYQNLAFPLKCRNWDRPKIQRRVEEIADLLGLTARLGQSARRLTADEKQLISLGRGLVRDDVAALLMDEPLTVIDPQMKFELRRKIKQANDSTRHTVIYVTHDQNEAMTFADEVLVMRSGRVVQRGTPKDLFENPVDTYVGNFIGSPGMNFVQADHRDGKIMLAGTTLVSGFDSQSVSPTAKVAIGIRPEHLSFASEGEVGIAASMESAQYYGNVRVFDFAVGTERVKMKVPHGTPVPRGVTRLRFPEGNIRVYVDGVLAD